MPLRRRGRETRAPRRAPRAAARSRLSLNPVEIFVPGRLCLFGEHSDWAALYRAADPSIAPGVGTPVKGGLNYREAHMVMEMIADSGLLLALDLVEVNPVLDDRNMTAILGAELASSALGQKIL